METTTHHERQEEETDLADLQDPSTEALRLQQKIVDNRAFIDQITGSSPNLDYCWRPAT